MSDTYDFTEPTGNTPDLADVFSQASVGDFSNLFPASNVGGPDISPPTAPITGGFADTITALANAITGVQKGQTQASAAKTAQQIALLNAQKPPVNTNLLIIGGLGLGAILLLSEKGGKK